jgi:hypothetical protein
MQTFKFYLGCFSSQNVLGCFSVATEICKFETSTKINVFLHLSIIEKLVYRVPRDVLVNSLSRQYESLFCVSDRQPIKGFVFTLKGRALRILTTDRLFIFPVVHMRLKNIITRDNK